ncbi:DUF309 domain-containing protein [Cohnella endophytica]|uniref:DUF309 domain-containing protein n=2 Tax=Cohnella endophytica TaxID=2419778 RepID=A0A494XX65_9BACL|nr:DUF309 domain-containing protein [Cohnella endophytica]
MDDPRLIAFVSLFNRDRDYFECHEVMEELWLEEGRSPLLQGLLQAAVGLHHWDNGNPSGAAKLIKAALEKLRPFGDIALGMNLVHLRDDLSRSLEALSESRAAPFQAFALVLCDERLSRGVERWEL